MITVCIPVGPYEASRRWLEDCLASIANQDCKYTDLDEVLIIDDQAELSFALWQHLFPSLRIDIWRTPWLSGVAHSFNYGVALARNDLVVMLGSDDLLEPHALADLKRTYEKHQDDHAYYHFDVRYMDTGEVQTLPCHAAAVTKQLWELNGGFPPESAIGAPDTILVSMMLAAKGEAGRLIRVESESPPYLYRRHAESDTGRRLPFPLTQVRDILTKEGFARWKSLKSERT